MSIIDHRSELLRDFDGGGAGSECLLEFQSLLQSPPNVPHESGDLIGARIHDDVRSYLETIGFGREGHAIESSKVQAHRDVRTGDDDSPAAQVIERVDAAESGVVQRERFEILKFPCDRVPTPNVARFMPQDIRFRLVPQQSQAHARRDAREHHLQRSIDRSSRTNDGRLIEVIGF